MGVGFSTPVSLGVRASSIASTGFDALCAEQHELTWNDPTRLQQAEALEKIATALIARYVGAAGNTVISLRSLATAIVEVAALASQGTVPWHIRRDGILAGVERR